MTRANCLHTQKLSLSPALERKRQILLAALDRVNGTVSNNKVYQTEGGDIGDIGSSITAVDSALAIMSSSTNIAHEIAHALNKLTKGTYGICELSGKPIGADRLDAIPWARFSIESQQAVESGNATVTRTGRPSQLFNDSAVEMAEEEETAQAE